MSESYFVRGIMEPTEDYKRKFAAFKACQEAGIEIPEELWKYFNDETPYEGGADVKIPFETVKEPGSFIYEVDLKKLPPQVTKVHFVISF